MTTRVGVYEARGAEPDEQPDLEAESDAPEEALDGGSGSHVIPDVSKPDAGDQSPLSWLGIVIGVAFWIIVPAGVLWLVFGPDEGRISVEVARAPELEISGRVTYEGQPVNSGTLELVLDDPTTSRHAASAVLDVNQGRFTTEKSPSLRTVKREQELRIHASFTGTYLDDGKPKHVSADELFYTNCTPPFSDAGLRNAALLVGAIALGLIFLFTMTLTRRSAAVLFGSAYLFIFLSVTVPIIGLLFVTQNHYLIDMMKRSPIGIVVGETKAVQNEQWLLNVGGTVREKQPDRNTQSAHEVDPTPPKNDAPGPAPEGSRSAPTQLPSARAVPDGDAADAPAPLLSAAAEGIVPRPPEVAGAPASSASAVPSAGALLTASEPRQSEPAPANSVGTPPNGADPKVDTPAQIEVRRVTIVEGGLAIPFYVVILAVFGAGINMMRNIPRIQAAHFDKLPAPVGHAMIPTMPHLAPALAGAGAKQAASLKMQIDASCDIRREVIEQYMYLLSAPFLAIAVYFLLQILATNISEPVLVLMAFSAGLVSESIVAAVIDFARKMLNDKPDPEKT